MPNDLVTSAKLRSLLPLYLVIFIAFIGYAMMMTFFVPMLMHNYGYLPASASTAQRTTIAGVLLAIYPLGQFFGSPVLGAISDRFGRRLVLLVSLAVAIFCYALIAFAIGHHNLVLLGVACLLGGLSESNIAIVQSAVADVASPEDRGRLFAYIYTACSCGYIGGPLLGGLIAVRWGFGTPFWGVVALLALTLAWTAISFRETHLADHRRSIDLRIAFRNLATVFTDLPIRRLYLINFIFYFAIFGYFRVILMYMADKWHMLAHQSGVYYSYFAAMSLVASLFCVAPLLRRFKTKDVAIWSAVLAGTMMLIVVVPEARWSLWLTAGPASLIATFTLTCCATLLSNSVEGERQGRVMGNNQALQVGAEAAGALVGGLLAAVVVPLPIVVYGLLLIGGGLMLIPVSPVEGLKSATGVTESSLAR